jgi:hypothetical protein
VPDDPEVELAPEEPALRADVPSDPEEPLVPDV